MNNDFKEMLIAKLRARGERITPLRKKVLDIFIRNGRPLSALDLVEKLKKSAIKCNKTTIYRQIEDLVRFNLLEEIQLGDRVVRYELNTGNHHHHLVCMGCRKVEEIKLANDLEKEERRLEKQKKFKTVRHSLEFFGTCAKCS